MARRKTKFDPASSGKIELTISLAKTEEMLRDRVKKGNELLVPLPTNLQELESTKSKYYTWDDYNVTLLRQFFSTIELASEYSFSGIVASGPESVTKRIEDLVERINYKIQVLNSVIERLLLYTNEGGQSSQTASEVKSSLSGTRKVFVVHGRDNEFKETVASYLVRLELEPIILHEQANVGRTIIEKFEDNSDSCYAVVLLTPDDVGGLASRKSTDTLNKRARQNVIFEWGFFVAKLGRPNVCALVAEGVEIPSDMGSIINVELDNKGAWKVSLARELKAGGIDVDLNLVL
jgi:predicted nucleotide-binding protein